MKFQISNFKFQKNKTKNIQYSIFNILILILLVFGSIGIAVAASPSGADWFQLLTDHQTGGDNTGDGGTGNVADYNYYYVGQNFTTNIQIKSDTGTNAANIWIDYDTAKLNALNLQSGTFFPTWSGQNITLGRIKSTGYRTSGYSTGTGSFGSVTFSALAPTVSNYGTLSPTTIDINIGTVGDTTESNISRDGLDILDDAEDFRIHIWADTKKPYAKNPSPANSVNNVSVDNNYTFELRDSKAGEGNDSGVGTGVNTSGGSVIFNDGSGPINYNASTTFGCSGVWGTNLCNTTVNPPSASGIAGDQRNWKYNTTYTATISNFRDLASTNQNQLGDANGPNTMDTKSWAFTTEADTVAPRTFNESPAPASSNVSVTTNISFDVQDKKIYPGSISGTGIDPASCRVNISSFTFPLTTFQQGGAGVTVSAIDYGYHFAIDPGSNFGQNETVSVSIYDCRDLAGNTMATNNYTFSTLDQDAPYVDELLPADDAGIAIDGNFTFHIKDDGVGVDLDNTVIFVNGAYYTKNGGAGSVTTTGTKITFSSSLSFEGGNYIGDTTGVTGTSGNYTFLINPQNNFNGGEAIPVIIYTRDISNNLMNRFVYALVAGGGSGVSGSSYCGGGTTWDGSFCVSSCGGGSSTSAYTPTNYCGKSTTWDGNVCIGNFFGPDYCGEGTNWDGTKCVVEESKQPSMIYNPSIIQVDEKSVLVTWFTTIKGSSKVIHDTVSHPDGLVDAYPFSSGEEGEATYYHSMLIEGLTSGKLYYFRPVSKINGKYVYGEELKMAPQLVTEIKEVIKEVTKEVIVERIVPGLAPTTPGEGGTGGAITTPTTTPTVTNAELEEIKRKMFGDLGMENGEIIFSGYTKPFATVKVNMYK